ncbi:hypothetical protein ACFQ0G_36365 [Streptomyces chiangmaiensis]
MGGCVDFGAALFALRPDGVHWTTEAIVAHAAGRRFARVDNERSPADESYVTEHRPGQTLLYHVDPWIGLRERTSRCRRTSRRRYRDRTPVPGWMPVHRPPLRFGDLGGDGASR